MENRNEPLSAEAWTKEQFGNVDSAWGITWQIMEAYADYIKSFQPKSNPIDNSVAFAEWVGKSPFIYDYTSELWEYKGKGYTTTELYLLFLNQKDKK